VGHNGLGWLTFGKFAVRGTIPTGIPGVVSLRETELERFTKMNVVEHPIILAIFP